MGVQFHLRSSQFAVLEPQVTLRIPSHLRRDLKNKEMLIFGTVLVRKWKTFLELLALYVRQLKAFIATPVDWRQWLQNFNRKSHPPLEIWWYVKKRWVNSELTLLKSQANVAAANLYFWLFIGCRILLNYLFWRSKF